MCSRVFDDRIKIAISGATPTVAHEMQLVFEAKYLEATELAEVVVERERPRHPPGV
jgi:hypothetical protein